MLKLTKCWAQYDDDGECIDDSTDDIELSFRDLIDLIRYCHESSCYPSTGSINEWVYLSRDDDYHNGGQTEETLHYDRGQPERRAKYWRKAFEYVGIVR